MTRKCKEHTAAALRRPPPKVRASAVPPDVQASPRAHSNSREGALVITRVSPNGVAEGTCDAQSLAPVKEETEEHDLGSSEGEDAPGEGATRSKIVFTPNPTPASGPGPAGGKSTSQLPSQTSPRRSPRRAPSGGEPGSTRLMGPPAAVVAQRAREVAARRGGSPATVSPRDRLAESTSAGTDPLTPSEAPVSTGQPRKREADAFQNACKRQTA